MGKNIKGSDFNRQIKNIIIRCIKIGVSKRDSPLNNQIHSIRVLESRQSLLKDFKNYLENQNIRDGKINNYMNDTILRGFITERVRNLKYNSSKTIISSMSGIITSLIETNVNINISSDFFIKMKDEIKENKYTYQSTKDIHKSFNDVDKVIKGLYEKSAGFGTLGNILRDTGFRYKEGVKLLSNPDQYISNGKIINMPGKSGKIYEDKTISASLVEKIYSLSKEERKINHSSFTNSIKKIEDNKSAHSFRYQFVKEKYQSLMNGGLSHNETMKTLSRQLNHFRNTTPYYLNRI